MAQRLTRRAEYADLTRSALLDAGTELILKQGYADTSLAQIARDARVSKGAIYHHFADKKALFKEILLRSCEQSATEVSESIADAANLPAAEVTSLALDAALEAARNDETYRALRGQAIAILDPAERHAIDDLHRVPLVSAILTGIQSRGQLRSDVDVSAASTLVIALLESACDEILASDNPVETHDQLRPVLSLFVESLTVGNSSSADG